VLGRERLGHDAHALFGAEFLQQSLAYVRVDDQVVRTKVGEGPGLEIRRDVKVEARVVFADVGRKRGGGRE
jgi:hypothetical protein